MFSGKTPPKYLTGDILGSKGATFIVFVDNYKLGRWAINMVKFDILTIFNIFLVVMLDAVRVTVISPTLILTPTPTLPSNLYTAEHSLAWNYHAL